MTSGTSGSTNDGGPAAGAPSGARSTIEVRRSGGFAGLSLAGSIAPGDAEWDEATALLGRIDLRAVTTSAPQPDRFTFVFVVDGREVTVAEQDLTDDQRRLAELVLRRGQER
jgi:hypothetical protein